MHKTIDGREHPATIDGILIDPRARTVIITMSLWPAADGTEPELETTHYTMSGDDYTAFTAPRGTRHAWPSLLAAWLYARHGFSPTSA